jgi:hypothetical protein
MRVTRGLIQSQQQSIESIANRWNANADSRLLEDGDVPARQSSELSARSLTRSRGSYLKTIRKRFAGD